MVEALLALATSDPKANSKGNGENLFPAHVNPIPDL